MKYIITSIILIFFSFGCSTGKTKIDSNITPTIDTENSLNNISSNEVHCIDLFNETTKEKASQIVAVTGYANLARSLFVEEEVRKFRKAASYYMQLKDKTTISVEETKINQCVELSLIDRKVPDYNEKIQLLLSEWEKFYKIELNKQAKELDIHEIKSCKKHAQSLHFSYIKKLSKKETDNQFNRTYSIYNECLNISLKNQGVK